MPQPCKPKHPANRPVIDTEEIVQGIQSWVRIESPTHDGDAVNRMADKVEADMRTLGARIERHPGRDGYGDILKCRTPWGGAGPGILVLAHIDTVHPLGSIETINPLRREDDVIYGPGIYDMKAGGFMAHYAYQHLVRLGQTTPLPITFLYIPEEEIGNPTSRGVIEAEALKNKYVLVAEPARDGNKSVIARKGVGHFVITARGRASHAGARHEEGRSAIREMAHQILTVEALTDYAKGVTFNVGLIDGGTTFNVVPADCRVELDMRVPNLDLGEAMVEKILSLEARDPEIELEVVGGINRPPFEMTAGNQALFEVARRLAEEDGWVLEHCGMTGGGSDGNFTSALGVPTLDGLGADGAGAHAVHEQIYVESLAPRAKLLVRLFQTLS